MADFKTFIDKTARGESLSRDEARAAFDIMMTGAATPSQIGGFLMALRVRGETVDEITGAVETMREKMLPVSAPDDAIDIVQRKLECHFFAVFIAVCHGDGCAACGDRFCTRSGDCCCAAGIPYIEQHNRVARDV